MLLVARPVDLRFQSALDLHLRDVQGADLQAIRFMNAIADVLIRRLVFFLGQPHVLQADANRNEDFGADYRDRRATVST